MKSMVEEYLTEYFVCSISPTNLNNVRHDE
jgi:hypothetical protein